MSLLVKRILIIGATSTVALDVARLYSKQSAEFLLLARDQERLTQIEEELAPRVLDSRASDFLDREVTARSLGELLDQGPIDLVLIAQGYLGDQQESERSPEEAERQIAINFSSVVAQLILVSRALEHQGFGHIAVLSSVAGDRGRPRNYTYGAAKGALTLYLQGLRSRLWPGIVVTTVKLGPVVTKMSAGHARNATFIESEVAARGIVRAIERRRGEAYVPSFYGAIMLIVRLLPERIFQKFAFLSGR